MRWEPVAAMLALLGLALWLVLGTQGGVPADGIRVVQVRVGTVRGEIHVVEVEDAEPVYVLHMPGFDTPRAHDREQIVEMLGPIACEELTAERGNWLFRLFNITGWGSLVWIAIGLVGQAAFFLRMLVQWVVSEKSRKSVVPEAFWWLSLGGAAALFTYFVWRRDIVGVLGQTTGLVVYVRNLRLIHKNRPTG